MPTVLCFFGKLDFQGVVGMRVGGVRRVAVRPERGWKKQDPKCATEIDMGVMSGVPGAALAKVSQQSVASTFSQVSRAPLCFSGVPWMCIIATFGGYWLDEIDLHAEC